MKPANFLKRSFSLIVGFILLFTTNVANQNLQRTSQNRGVTPQFEESNPQPPAPLRATAIIPEDPNDVSKPKIFKKPARNKV